MQGVGQDLMRDVECYTCGEDPSPLVLFRAPRIENWAPLVRRRGKAFVLVVAGDVYGHPSPADFPDGTWISSSAIVWFDRHRRWIRTYKRLYRLGKPAISEEA